MNYLLEVCLITALATSITPSLVAQPNADAIPTMRPGISVQMPVTSTAVPMPDADQQDALIMTITHDGSIYLGLNPIDPAALAEAARDALSNQARKKLYLKVDARTAYADVVRVLVAIRTAGVEAPNLLTAQRGSAIPGALVVPGGLEVFVGSRLSSTSQAIVQVSNSEQQRSVLKVNGEPVPRASLQNSLAQFFQNRSDKIVQIEADGSLRFADVVDVIDGCRAAGAKVVLANPTL